MRRCHFLMSFQEGPHRNCSFKKKSSSFFFLKFCKQGGKLDYSSFSQESLCYHWQTLRNSFLLEMAIAKDDALSAILYILEI